MFGFKIGEAECASPVCSAAYEQRVEHMSIWEEHVRYPSCTGCAGTFGMQAGMTSSALFLQGSACPLNTCRKGCMSSHAPFLNTQAGHGRCDP